jgi:hypothetical protein
MEPEIRQMVETAYATRRDSGPVAALEAYRAAAERAKAIDDPQGLAHAQRHVADLARELGDVEDSREAASEAVALCRGLGEPHTLDLANALRLLALAEEAGGGDAAQRWREARELYRTHGVAAGVDECSAHLPD